MSEPLDFGVGFKSSAERIVGEREERLERAKRILPFGVQFLDDALGGIFPNDLIVVGAKTGVGKTALATAIAHEQVKAGKHVHYFALEAEDREIERRMKYRELSDQVYKSELPTDLKRRFNYGDWYAGKLEGMIGDKVNAELERRVAEQYKTLHTYYKRGDFAVDDLERLMLAIQDMTDLVILDHLHYLDVLDTDEHRGVKEIVKRIRDLSLILGKPVIVVAHLRKSDRRSPALVPDLDDFHGTSDITKIATKCILMSKASDQEQSKERPHLWPTYMHAPKCRTDGSRTRYCALLHFNARAQEYERAYAIGRLNFFGTEWEQIVSPSEIPYWASGAHWVAQ